MVFAQWGFSLTLISITLVNQNQELYLLLQLLNYSINYYISVDSQIFILCLGYNSILSFIFLLRLFHFWPLRTPSGYSLRPFDRSLFFFFFFLVSISLFSDTTKCIISSIFLPDLQSFSQESLLPFIGKWCLKANIGLLGVLIIAGVSPLLAVLSQEISVCLLTATFSCGPVCVYIRNHQFILVALIPTQSHNVHSSLPSIFPYF